MARNLTHDVEPVPEPGKLATRRRGEDRDLAIFALVTELLGYGLVAIESDTSASVVW